MDTFVVTISQRQKETLDLLLKHGVNPNEADIQVWKVMHELRPAEVLTCKKNTLGKDAEYYVTRRQDIIVKKSHLNYIN